MKGETRETKWAVLLDHYRNVSIGNKVKIETITPCGGHGGGYLDVEIETIKISDIKKIASNMLLVSTHDTDYYMYCYKLSDKSLYVPANENWLLSSRYPQIGEKLLFERDVTANPAKDEPLLTNPVFKIDIIYKGLQIAWCKDNSVGKDIGYIIDIHETDKASEEATGNYYWLWNTGVLTAGQEKDAKITVDLSGKRITRCMRFIPKSAISMEGYTIIVGEDGNYYIRMLPMDRCWRE